MSERNPNPYAPSQAVLRSVHAPNAASTGVWSNGRELVMAYDASLPARCVKCNAPAHQPTRMRKVYWHHPALYLLVFFWGILYVIVALMVRRKADVNPGLCERHKRHRGIAIAVGVLGPVLGFFLVFVSPTTPVLVPIGLVVVLVSVIHGFARGRIVYVRKIDDFTVRLGGICRDYLDKLPEWRG